MNEEMTQIELLEAAMKRVIPFPKGTIEDDGDHRRVGQYYLTIPEPTFPAGLPKECKTDDPVCVVIMAENTMDMAGHAVHLVAPVFPGAENAGPEDIILPREVLPYRPAIAVGSCFSLLDDSLGECKGRLPEATIEGLQSFRAFLAGDIDTCPAVVTGPDYIDEKDIRFKFHEDLVERIGYLQGPVMAWAAQSGILKSGAVEYQPFNRNKEVAKMTEEEREQIIEVVRGAVASGKFREELNQESADLLRKVAGGMFIRGAIQSPGAAVCWVGSKVAKGSVAVYKRVTGMFHKRAAARKAKADATAIAMDIIEHQAAAAAAAAAEVVDPLGAHNCPAGSTVLDAVTGNLEPDVAKA